MARRSPRAALFTGQLTRGLRTWGSCGLALCAPFAWLGVAQAEDAAPPTKTSCAEAYESSQETRASGHLQEARTGWPSALRPSVQRSCQKDCARWLEEVERELPSVVISVAGLDRRPTRAANSEDRGVAERTRWRASPSASIRASTS
jgi:hypothetical protein